MSRDKLVLLFGEMWDGINYYGLQSILVLYMATIFLFSDTKAYMLFGVCTTLAFSAPIIGGYIADKFLGYQHAILYGVALLILGNIVLLVPQIHHLYLGLAIMIAGIGLFKANNVSIFSTLYKEQDSKKEAGFTIFYMIINVGCLFGPLLYGFIAIKYGWSRCFILGIVGSCLSLGFYLSRHHYFKELLQNYYAQFNKVRVQSFSRYIVFYLGVIAAIALICLLFFHPQIFGELIWLVAAAVVITITTIALKQDSHYRQSIFLLLILEIFAIFYFASEVQINTSLMLFIDRCVNTHIFGFKIPVASFASLEPFFVIVSAPLLAPLWTMLERRHQAPSIIFRVIMGVFLAAVGFIIFALTTKLKVVAGVNYPLIGIVAGNLFLGAGELCVGPAILSSITYLVPKQLRGTFMGFSYFFIAFAAYIGSLLARLSAVHIKSKTLLLTTNATLYFHAFITIAVIGLVACVLAMLLAPILKKALPSL